MIPMHVTRGQRLEDVNHGLWSTQGIEGSFSMFCVFSPSFFFFHFPWLVASTDTQLWIWESTLNEEPVLYEFFFASFLEKNRRI